jgi:hypothetical protein
MEDAPDSGFVFEFSIDIDAPTGDAYDLIADLCRASQIAGAPTPKLLTAPPLSVGTRWLTKQGLGLWRTYSEVVEFDRPRSLVRRVSGNRISGSIEDVFQARGSGTRVTHKVSVRGPSADAFLHSRHLDFFQRIKLHLEDVVRGAAESEQIERDAKDQARIAAEIARIRGSVVPRLQIEAELLSGLAHPSEPERLKQRERFGQRGYPHGALFGDAGPVLSLLRGPTNLYVTCLWAGPGARYRRAISTFCRHAPHALTGGLRPTRLLVPKEGHEEVFWEDAVSLLEKPELDTRCRHLWRKDRCFIILTSVHPARFVEGCFPLVSIDVTDVLPEEMRWLIVSIARLGSSWRFLPIAFGIGYGRALFEQKLPINLQGRPRSTAEGALDILSLPVLLAPSMTIDFKYFSQEITRRFEAICDETLESRPGALPFAAILRDRREHRRRAHSSTMPLLGESEVRQFWN